VNSSSERIITELQHRGVQIICPESVYIDPAIDPERISRDGVVLHPGTRLHGADTLIGPGCVVGEESPATLDDCALGKRVHFKGGYGRHSALLDDTSISTGAQVREGCIMEEQSSAATSVGLKQTVLMPYVTVGSVVNFCDALMAGGTKRHDHSEVGSGVIHFNFTPAGTKATASLFGDVPRGVFLRERRIFIGGLVGMIGPLKVGFGSVVGAGSVLRDDVADDEFVLNTPAQDVHRPVTPPGQVKPFKLVDTVAKNIDYIAQLRALKLWYASVRMAYCGRSRLGGLLNQTVQNLLDESIIERGNRLKGYADAITANFTGGRQFIAKVDDLIEAARTVDLPVDQSVVAAINEPALQRSTAYLDAMSALPVHVVAAGQAWLQNVVDTVGRAAASTIPAVDLRRWSNK